MFRPWKTCSIAPLLLFAVMAATDARAAQAQTQKTSPAPTAPATAPTSNDVQVPPPAERNPRYKIQRADVLELTFPLSTEFNQKVRVQPDGYISLQGAGSISVLGLTLPEVSQAIKNAYFKVLHEPIVDVNLVEFQRPYFIVTGQVGKPGQYDLRSDITVSEAIAIAGGFMPTAKTEVYLYHRDATGWVQARQLKLKDFLHGRNVNEDSGMRPGDMIFVPEKTITKIRKYIPYSVGTSVYSSSF